jgi:hypothetical protein
MSGEERFYGRFLIGVRQMILSDGFVFPLDLDPPSKMRGFFATLRMTAI